MSAALHIEKLMTLSRNEFLSALGNVGGVEPAGQSWRARLAEGSVAITYTPQPSVRLGGLLDLPRAKITLEFQNADDAARKDFLQRFDLAFQRGGG